MAKVAETATRERVKQNRQNCFWQWLALAPITKGHARYAANAFTSNESRSRSRRSFIDSTPTPTPAKIADSDRLRLRSPAVCSNIVWSIRIKHRSFVQLWPWGTTLAHDQKNIVPSCSFFQFYHTVMFTSLFCKTFNCLIMVTVPDGCWSLVIYFDEVNPRPAGVFSRTRPAGGGGGQILPPCLTPELIGAARRARRRSKALNEKIPMHIKNCL